MCTPLVGFSVDIGKIPKIPWDSGDGGDAKVPRQWLDVKRRAGGVMIYKYDMIINPIQIQWCTLRLTGRWETDLVMATSPAWDVDEGLYANVTNTKYWKNLHQEPTLRRRRGRRWREGPTWSWRAMHSRAPEPQSSFSQHSKSWLFLHLDSSTSALFNGIHRPQFLWKIWHSSLLFKTTVSNNTCTRRS